MEFVSVQPERDDDYGYPPNTRWGVFVFGTFAHRQVTADTEEEALRLAQIEVGYALVKVMGCDIAWHCWEDEE